MSQSTCGIVYLVGAGPGDPGLITVRGARLLEQAEVVVYDYLANPKLLSYCPLTVHAIYVGKKAAEHTMTQAEISQLLVDLGRQGKRVVRLKGGDPYVFGRGGEEGEALRAADVPFEVVPGITAAIAAPCYAGIPVTHRDFNSSFTFITGHEKEEEYKDDRAALRGPAAGSSDLDWSAIARLPCFAFYMGVKALPRICQRLIEHGMSPDTPAATIQWGTRPNQRTVVATIGTLVESIERGAIGSPAITIVGRVVTMRDTLNWFERRPLFGRSIVVTRTRQQASDLSAKLEALGADVIEAPTIELAPPSDWTEVDSALRSLGTTEGRFDWVIFTSANGVTHAKQRLLELGLDARGFTGMKVAAIGTATGEAVRRDLCLKVDLFPQSFVAEALADELEKRGEVRGKRHLLLRADIARTVLRERLESGGSARVADVAVYETRRADTLPPHLVAALDGRRVDWITFTSSSTARNFVELLGERYRPRLAGARLASIGPVTTTTLRELGLSPSIEAAPFTIDGLVEAILSVERASGRPSSSDIP